MIYLTVFVMLTGAGMIFYSGERIKADPSNLSPLLFLVFGVLFIILGLMVADLSRCGCGC